MLSIPGERVHAMYGVWSVPRECLHLCIRLPVCHYGRPPPPLCAG